MEVKKTPKADLQNKKGLFLQIGLIASLALCIGMFGVSKSEKVVEIIDMQLPMVEEEVMEITTQEKTPQDLPRQSISVVSEILNIVKNDAKITNEVDFMDFTEDAVVVKHGALHDEYGTAEPDAPFFVVEDMPKFMGGDLTTFRNWVQSRVKYPSLAQENNIQGRVTIKFVVEKDGSVGRIEVLGTPDRSLSEETIRVLKMSPKWTPGKQRNTPVPVTYTLPVEFRIQQ